MGINSQSIAEMIAITAFCRQFEGALRIRRNHSVQRQQASVLSEHSARGDFGSRFISQLVQAEDGLLTTARGELAVLEYSGALEADLPKLREGQELSKSADTALSESRWTPSSSALRERVAVRPGDVVQCGLHVTHDRCKNHATPRSEAYFLRLECSNGLTSCHWRWRPCFPANT